jgi:hypothetical protein
MFKAIYRKKDGTKIILGEIHLEDESPRVESPNIGPSSRPRSVLSAIEDGSDLVIRLSPFRLQLRAASEIVS